MILIVIMQCLIDFVGIRGCGTQTTPPSGLYINSLPGISMKMMDKIADEETKTFMGVWDEINIRAALAFENKVTQIMTEDYKLCRIQEVINFGKVLTTDVIAPASEWRGFTIEQNHEEDLYYKNSSLSQGCVDEIFIYSAGIVASVPVKVFDLDTGEELYSTTANLVAGWNTIEVNQCFDEQNVFVAYWGELVTSKQLNLNNCNGCSCGCCDIYYTGGSGEVDELTFANSTKGISGCWYMRCRWNNLVCCAKQEFAYPWSYMLGMEIMSERLSSDRLNRYTTIDIKTAERLRKEFSQTMETGLRSVLKQISISQYDCCVECNNALTIQEHDPRA